MTNEKQAVALSSMFASALMTIGKFVIGFMTGSLGLISEGLHSLLDFFATVMTYAAVRISDKPADDKHHYGHGKIESVTALGETILLFLTCFWVLYEAVNRLWAGNYKVEVNAWSFGVIIVSILIDISRARALSRVAKKTKSQALEADALHFSSDVLSSIVVIIGLIFAALGWPEGDAFAAIGVAIFVCVAGWRLGRKTIDALVDMAPMEIVERLRKIIEAVPAVIKIDWIRARQSGHVTYAEIRISISRGLPLDRVKALEEKILREIRTQMQDIEATISVTPVSLDSETVTERIHAIAANQQIYIHHVTAHQVDGGLAVSLDLEVDSRKSLREAHDVASHLEASIVSELGSAIEVETHIDPLEMRDDSGESVEPMLLETLKELLRKAAESLPDVRDIHAVKARRTPRGLVLLFHCGFDPLCSVQKAHEVVDSLEREIRVAYPDLYRVVGHAEPIGCSCHFC